MLGREAVGNLHRFVERAHQHDGAVARDGFRAPPAPWAASASCRSTSFATAWASRFDVVSSIGRGIHIVLGLRQHVGGEMARIALGGDDQDLRGPGDEIDSHFARQQFLGRRHVDVAGPDDAVGARHRARAVGEGRDGLRAAHLENVRARPSSAAVPKTSRTGLRRGHADVAARPPPAPESPSSSGWKAADSGRRECRPPPYRAAARSVPAACRRLTGASIRAASGVRRIARMLAAAVSTAARNSGASAASRARAVPSPARARSCAPARRTGARTPAAPIAALAHGLENRPHHRFGLGQARGLARQQAADLFAFENADHRTILFSGYSTMPSPPACFSRGNDVAHRGFVQNRVHRQPLLVAQVRNGGPLQRRQHRQHGRQIVLDAR